MPYPVSTSTERDQKSEAEMALLQSLIVSVRAARKDAGVPERDSVPILLRTLDASVFQQNLATIQRLARVTTLEVVPQLPEGVAHRNTPAFDVAVAPSGPEATNRGVRMYGRSFCCHKRFLRYVRHLTPRSALRKAGVLSRRFWLRGALSK